MERKRGRGRPVTYKLQERRRLAELIRQHGATGARERSANSICMHTLLKIAGEFEIKLNKGRRLRKAA